MDFEQTEQEQVERLHKWWQDNWLPLVGGLVLGLGAILGWDQYKAWKLGQAATASQLFEAVRSAAAADEAAGASAPAEQLLADFPKSPYAANAQLLLARLAVTHQDWDKAAGHLEWVMNKAGQPELKNIAQLRLARVKWAAGDEAAALALLDAGPDNPFAGAYAELRGDIQRRAGNMEAARAAYEQALDAGQGIADRAGLQRKLDDLPARS